MRIALLGSHPPSVGGVAVHVASLARALRDRGADVRVLDLGASRELVPGVLPARGAARLARALALAALERRLVHVHTSGANAPSWAVALAAGRARLPGAPRPVLTLHSGRLQPYLAASARRQALARAACAPYGRVFAVSAAVAAGLRAADVAQGRVAVLPAYLPGAGAPGAEPPGLAAFRGAHAPLLAAALAPGPTYGEDLLARALPLLRRRFPRAGLVVFGPASDRGTLALGGPAQGVLALGALEHGQALAAIAAADAFVRPTRHDGDAISVREALALGVRVVASDAATRPPGCELFPSGDAAALATALDRALARSAPAPRQGVAADPVEVLLATYRALEEERPIPSRSGGGSEGPCSPR